ncbi:aspartic proteinase CDR1-like [Syzygium oleosum]|uniref:aspartic proteinase CDR1-like n=1 Tax=Syzygium oleosum TaxID=219896 RepID=UPI0024B8FADF|nr:aspartic proteinase CDR1-like [Syzygium oleosum]
MTSSYFFFIVSCIIIIISSYPASVASSKTTLVKPRGLAIELIHHDSIQSSYYNPKVTISEQAERAINGSLARIHSLSKISATPNDDDVRATLIPTVSLHGFVGNISISMPPVPQLVLLDTGSDLLYIDKSTIAGNFTSQQATFETSDEGTIKVPIEVLGCGHSNKYGVDGQESGILGLGLGDGYLPNLVKQLGSKFSYCFDLQGISVGEKKLQIDPLVFKRGLMGQGGVIIDSRTTFTFLKEEGYVSLQNKVESLMARKLNRVSHPEFLCYSGSVERDLTRFPVVTLQFWRGTQLSLDTNSMFFQLAADVLCMAISKSLPDMSDLSVIGVLAQQSYNIGYDIRGGNIFFQRIDCNALQSLV